MVIIDETQIAENFNEFIREIRPKLAKEIETPTIKFDDLSRTILYYTTR